MRGYLKGIHSTIDSWRENRDEDGWKDPDWFGSTETNPSQDLPPETVLASTRLRWDLEALTVLFDAPSVAIWVIRPSSMITVKYGFGDASGSGFGSSITGESGSAYRIGVWGHDADGESSNYREFRNLVETIELEAPDGNLSETEMFLFTDNTTAESVFYRGASSNRKLFNLVLRLRLCRVKMTCGMILHVIHCAGTRMISQGTDGLS
jgi:hypothetical protein